MIFLLSKFDPSFTLTASSLTSGLADISIFDISFFKCNSGFTGYGSETNFIFLLSKLDPSFTFTSSSLGEELTEISVFLVSAFMFSSGFTG